MDERVVIYKVSNDSFSELINQWTKNRKIPNRLYFTKLNDDLYIGLDNEYGSCYVEEFDSKDRVLCWLIRSDYSASEINKLIDIKVKKLFQNSHYSIKDLTGKKYGL